MISNYLKDFEDDEGLNALYSVFRSVIIPKGLDYQPDDMVNSDFSRYWSGYDLESLSILVQPGVGLTFTNEKLDNSLESLVYKNIAIKK